MSNLREETQAMNDDDKKLEDFKSEYRSDKRWGGWSSISFGVLFIVWTAFDIATDFWEEFWYVNVFFLLLGIVFIFFGFRDVRKYSSKKPNDRS